MSTEPQALERSVLERKEREELAAIATALGAKPAARASKATLIDQILREAGVEAAPEAKPKRGRGSKAAASDNGAAAPDGDEAATPLGLPAAPSDGATAQAGGLLGSQAAVRPAFTGGSELTVAPVQRGDGGRAGGGPERPSERGAGPERPAERGAGTHPGVGGTRVDDRGPRDRGRQGPSGAGFEAAEPGNRRSRRRRGRDRERGERELQGQGGTEQPYTGEVVPVEGLLDLRDEGFGFLRTSGYLASSKDVYVSLSQVRRFALRRGDYVVGASRPANSSEKYPALVRIDTVCGLTPDEARLRPRFEDLTPLFPDEKLRLEIPGDNANMTARIVDLISPIGKGQRGMIVSPPKAGKTTILKQIAHSIETNNPEVHLMVLLVDERPEEVTDMRRSVKGEVVASTFDRPSDEHTALSELAIDRARRLVELGRDVVIVLDGITRLARAYNLAQPATGRIMSGGVDSGALYPPKKFFGAARNVEEGGSLTILATALVETGSRMDEVIFEEFKGTGNMELRLDRKLAERRIYPAIDVDASSTRHEELLFERVQLQQVWKLRRVLSALENGAGLELLMDKIRTTKSNDEFLAEIAKAPTPGA